MIPSVSFTDAIINSWVVFVVLVFRLQMLASQNPWTRILSEA